MKIMMSGSNFLHNFLRLCTASSPKPYLTKSYFLRAYSAAIWKQEWTQERMNSKQWITVHAGKKIQLN